MMDMVHAGGVLVQDRAHILSNAVIAAAVFRQFTRVGEDSRIGNLAFLSHNVQVGPRCFVGHGAVVCGNTRLGAEVWIGPGATVSNNLQIGDRGKVSLGAAVVGDVPPESRVTGNIAIDHHKLLRHMASLK
jgi:UDP-3-O-[3-hydroxymyristoyl] glucosamine N-acyltransferase